MQQIITFVTYVPKDLVIQTFKNYKAHRQNIKFLEIAQNNFTYSQKSLYFKFNSRV